MGQASREIRDAFEKHGILNSSVCMDAAIMSTYVERGERSLGRNRGKVPCSWADDPLLEKVWQAVERIDVLVKRFDREVWLGGFGKEYLAQRSWGYEVPLGKDRILLTGTAGRVLLTFHIDDGTDIGSQITLITVDNVKEPCMGVQSWMCTEEEATTILTDAIDCFKSGGLGMKENRKVGIAGF
jgi:hypothetical protein